MWLFGRHGRVLIIGRWHLLLRVILAWSLEWWSRRLINLLTKHLLGWCLYDIERRWLNLHFLWRLLRLVSLGDDAWWLSVVVDESQVMHWYLLRPISPSIVYSCKCLILAVVLCDWCDQWWIFKLLNVSTVVCDHLKSMVGTKVDTSTCFTNDKFIHVLIHVFKSIITTWTSLFSFLTLRDSLMMKYHGLWVNVALVACRIWGKVQIRALLWLLNSVEETFEMLWWWNHILRICFDSVSICGGLRWLFSNDAQVASLCLQFLRWLRQV